MNKVLHYIISFLAGDDIPGELISRIGYTGNRNQFDRYNIVIVPSGFFDEHTYGKASSLPPLPLQELEGVPVLFGSPQIEQIDSTCVIHADLIASTYFLITRYEEMIRRNVRDEHGRFPGRESLPYRGCFIDRPIIDQYRVLLRKKIQQAYPRIPDIPTKLSNIYLTHDIDSPTLYRSWKGVVRSVLDGRSLWCSIKGKFGHPEKDPYYTFPSIFRLDAQLQAAVGDTRCHSLLFFRAGGKSKQDKPRYNLCSRDMQTLIREALENKAHIGLHSSYEAGRKPSLIGKEKAKLEKASGKTIRYNRHHYLSCREPEDMDLLEASGITDDFTMGYADVAGFRLGTSHPVRWINPITRRLSPLVLHPLPIMDCTLEDNKYMGLGHEEARIYSLQLIERISDVGGELVLLWHNTSFATGLGSYLSELYTNLLKELESK